MIRRLAAQHRRHTSAVQALPQKTPEGIYLFNSRHPYSPELHTKKPFMLCYISDRHTHTHTHSLSLSLSTLNFMYLSAIRISSHLIPSRVGIIWLRYLATYPSPGLHCSKMKKYMSVDFIYIRYLAAFVDCDNLLPPTPPFLPVLSCPFHAQ